MDLKKNPLILIIFKSFCFFAWCDLHHKKNVDKGEKKQSGPIHVTFIFLLSDTLTSAGVFTFMEMDKKDK